MNDKQDIEILRPLAERVREIAAMPVQDERRELWRRIHSLDAARPMLFVDVSMPGWDCFGSEMRCADPFFRQHEYALRSAIFHHGLEDDCVVEPWITQTASYVVPKEGHWGISPTRIPSTAPGGAWKTLPSIKVPGDVRKMTVPWHEVDEKQTALDLQRIQDAVGDILEVNLSRKPFMSVWGSHISGDLGELRGIETVMYDMLDNPQWLHGLLASMRDGILKIQQEAEDAGDWSLGDHENQSVPYCTELPDPKPNSGPVKRKDLWCLMAAQEMTLISPQMHDEFMLRYQIPIMEHWGLVHYGCCEDLSEKIDILRQVRNLRSIAVTPWANVPRAAEQIRTDYVASWRPSPADTVCCGFQPQRVRSILRNGVRAFREHGCPLEINLKDVKTVEGDGGRLRRFARIAREVIDEFY